MDNFRLGAIYQFLVIGAIITFLGWGFAVTGEFNDIFMGALIGVLVGLPFREDQSREKNTGDKQDK